MRAERTGTGAGPWVHPRGPASRRGVATGEKGRPPGLGQVVAGGPHSSGCCLKSKDKLALDSAALAPSLPGTRRVLQDSSGSPAARSPLPWVWEAPPSLGQVRSPVDKDTVGPCTPGSCACG